MGIGKRLVKWLDCRERDSTDKSLIAVPQSDLNYDPVSQGTTSNTSVSPKKTETPRNLEICRYIPPRNRMHAFP